MGQAISEFGITRPSFFNPLENEEMYMRRLDHLQNFQECLVNIIAFPLPRKETMLYFLLCLLKSVHFGYRSL